MCGLKAAIFWEGLKGHPKKIHTKVTIHSALPSKTSFKKKVKEVFAELKEDSALLKGKVKEVLKEC